MKDFSSLVADNLSIQGDLEFSDGLKIDGRVHGSVSFKPGTTSLLALSVNGVVEGDVSSYDAPIVGAITYRQLSTENGVMVEGTLRRLDKAAPVLELPQPIPAALPAATKEQA